MICTITSLIFTIGAGQFSPLPKDPVLESTLKENKELLFDYSVEEVIKFFAIFKNCHVIATQHCHYSHTLCVYIRIT